MISKTAEQTVNAHEIFEQMNRHLLEDEKPSAYFNQWRSSAKMDYPFTMLGNLCKAEQSPIHHPEGNVWNHTMLVIDRAAALKRMSSNERVFMWTALLHDIGKPDTTRVRNGRITSYNHDTVGSKLARDFLTELNENEKFIEDVAALVRWHMQILSVVKSPSFADIERMKSQVPVYDVALFGICDRLGRLRPDTFKEENNIRQFLDKCGEEPLKIEKFFCNVHSIIIL